MAETRTASIIVPVYGAEKYLAQCLDSLLAQDYPEYDIILVDDCGKDRSLEIAGDYAARFPEKIRLLRNEENIGQGRSRMKAAAVSGADYIFFVDSDDYVAPDYIRRYMEENTEDYDLLIGSFIRDAGGKKAPFAISDSDYTILLYSVACCKAFKRSFLLEHGIDFSDSRKGEDIYFSLAWYACRPRYRIIPYIGYYYRENPDSTTQSMNHENNFERIVAEMFDRFRRKYHPEKLPEDMRRKIEYAYIANMVNAMAVYNRGCGRARMKEKLDFFLGDLQEHYPDWRKNRDLRLFRPAEVSKRIRTGVGAFYWSTRLHMVRGLFYGISRL